MATTHKWQFAPRFRRNAFGWKSQPAIARIKEALAEIKAVAKKEPAAAAEGAVLFLEKVAPAIAGVDSSSGAIGNAVYRAIETLVPIVAKADVDDALREKWLARLWQALEDDQMPYIESLGDFWGELCATPEIASRWADELVPALSGTWDCAGGGYFKGTNACLSALYAAARYDELLALLDKPRRKYWQDREWGAKALLASGKRAEAIRYAEDSRETDRSWTAIARFCEGVLLESGCADEAYAKYAVAAASATTNLAAFRAVAKKYPGKPAETILRDLVASQPGQEGKWFAAAKDSGLFELAIELAKRSPADPRTLIRAARDFANEQPKFALAAALTALRGIGDGHGYDITNIDVLDAYAAALQAAGVAGIDTATVKTDVRALIAASPLAGDFVERSLKWQLAN